jgi:MFS family permease
VIIFLESFTTLISNTGSSTAAAAAVDLGVSREIALICFTTTYLLAQALGGLVLPPIAETFGGRTLYITGTLAFTIGCVSMAASPNLPAVIAGRIICGFTSALPATVAVSSFENMFDCRSRIWVFHIWISAAVAALGMGPAVATYISTSSLGWYATQFTALKGVH